jgi:S1-C subfamily serine protease
VATRGIARTAATLLAGVALIATGAQAKLWVPDPVAVSPLPKGTHTRPVQLSRVAIRLQRGESIGHLKLGLLCIPHQTLKWRGGRVQVDPDEFDDAFQRELGTLGYDVVGLAGDLFETGEEQRAEYLLGGSIKAVEVDVCYPNSGFGNVRSAKGAAMLEVDWQLYSRLDRSVVARMTTRAGATQNRASRDGIEGLIVAAFAENVRALAASGKLQPLVGEPADLSFARVADKTLPVIRAALPARSVGGMAGVVGATVLVDGGDRFGSGFLISTDGYFLTNHHVVGSSKFVKLRWSDRIETVGEVVRVDKGRDVALIKGEARQRAPVRLAAAAPAVGQDVYAVGTPLDRALQSSVTKGILSARRVIDGYSFLQSDVSVLPGNSGGPLVNAQGDLIGMTVSGLQVKGAPQGVNFFIPADEALAFLGVR